MKLKKLLSTSFWIIMAIHLIVFSAIGIFTDNWRLLMIFLPAFIVTSIGSRLLRFYLKRRKEQQTHE